MKQLEALKQGDTVALVATARKVSREEVQVAIERFRSWGLNVLIPEGLYSEMGQLGGDDGHRAHQLQTMLDDPAVKAIICCRGGYGTVRIIDRLDFSRFSLNPKWIVGYSDVTVLHSHIHALCGIPTLHGTMPLNMGDEPSPADESLKKVLFGEGVDYQWKDSFCERRKGEAEGVIVGGNLSILYSLCGSPSAIHTNGKILLIEDLDEYLYHIDRMMQNLKRNGMLAGLAGLVVGGLTDMHDNSVPFGRTAEEIIMDAVAEYDYPVAFNAPFGHLGGNNMALPLGTTVRLVVDLDGNDRLTTV
jgi:muramoyltetrapeptide carboxypeptidase